MSTMVEKIANAVLYEGYILYPYRPSAVHNRQRWNFGVVYPRAFSELVDGAAPWEMETECLALGGPRAALELKVRCLRLVNRVAGYLSKPVTDIRECVEPAFVPANSIHINGCTYDSWQEATEYEMSLPCLRFEELKGWPIRQRFVHPAIRTVEPLRDTSGVIGGAIVRTQEELECWIEMRIRQVQDGLFRIRVHISNHTPLTSETAGNREAMLGRSLLSTHTILQVGGGEFISLLEPPPEFQEAAAACRNVGTWPVLAGEGGRRNTMLSSPIILKDCPKIAPTSPGKRVLGAEIGEILSSRILAFIDGKKDGMRRSTDRAGADLQHTETLPRAFRKAPLA